jgi:hypothetical protein
VIDFFGTISFVSPSIISCNSSFGISTCFLFF